MIAIFSYFFFFFFISSASSTITISISPQTLNRTGDTITIKWSGISSPSDLDWLGIYSPPESPHDHFIGYKFLTDSPNWQTGSGSISIPLTNLRSDYTFRIFHWTQSEINPKHNDHDHNPLPGTHHLLTESNRLTFRFGLNVPEQIHLAFTDTVNEMRVMFVTGDGEERVVRYGEVKEKLENVTVARGFRYELEHMCHAPANSSVGWRDPGWSFDAVMKNLQQGVNRISKSLVSSRATMPELIFPANPLRPPLPLPSSPTKYDRKTIDRRTDPRISWETMVIRDFLREDYFCRDSVCFF